MPEEQLLQLIKADAAQGIEIAIEQYGGAVKSICKSILAGCGGGSLRCLCGIVEIQR